MKTNEAMTRAVDRAVHRAVYRAERHEPPHPSHNDFLSDAARKAS